MTDQVSLARNFERVPKLIGMENFTVWRQRIVLALSMSGATGFVDPKAQLPEEEEDMEEWDVTDKKLAAAILTTLDEEILTAHIDLLDSTGPFRARSIYLDLASIYGTSGPQYSFAKGRQFIDNKCGEADNVENWVNQVQSQYRELKVLDFNLDTLLINVLLNGLPSRFAAFVDSVWTTDSHLTAEALKIKILQVNSGQLNR
ncbi:uncharacterized protein MKK02DRAFT_21837, partial [Dioszegia hungarica]